MGVVDEGRVDLRLCNAIVEENIRLCECVGVR